MSSPSNVVQFPLMRVLPKQIQTALEGETDVRETVGIAEAFQLAMPAHDLRNRVEAQTAQHVLMHVPSENGARREAALRNLLASFINRSTTAGKVANEAWAMAEAAQQGVVKRQQQKGGAAVEILRERADDLTSEAARLSIDAYRLEVEAAAAARVVSMASHGEIWQPFNLRSSEKVLFGTDAIASHD